MAYNLDLPRTGDIPKWCLLGHDHLQRHQELGHQEDGGVAAPPRHALPARRLCRRVPLQQVRAEEHRQSIHFATLFSDEKS
jgi:hypothetical protein